MKNISIFATLSFTFSVVAYFPYIFSIVKGKAKPTLSSWIAWWIMDVAILAGMLAKGTIVLQMVAYVSGCLAVICICLIEKASVEWKRLDTTCMLLVTLAIVLWYWSGDADLAIIMSLVAVYIGCIPVTINMWKNPDHEPILPWILYLIGSICGFIAIPKWTIADALTPTMFTISGSIFVILISRKFLLSR